MGLIVYLLSNENLGNKLHTSCIYFTYICLEGHERKTQQGRWSTEMFQRPALSACSGLVFTLRVFGVFMGYYILLQEVILPFLMILYE